MRPEKHYGPAVTASGYQRESEEVLGGFIVE